MKKITRFMLALVVAAGATTGAARAEYPEKSIRLIVPFAAGGTTDIVGRIVADHLTDVLKQPVVVDNRGGAGGTIGTELAATAPKDGYTLLLGTMGTLAINPGLYPNLRYDPIKDFAPVSLVAETPNLVVVRPDLPVKTLQELVEYVKKDPDGLNFGSAGSGSTSHLAGELFNQLTKGDMVHIPYKGMGPAMTDMLAGRVDLIINNMPPMVPHVKAGKMRAIAIADDARSPALPDVPTTVEAGLPEFLVTGWFGVFAPAGTPKDVISKLHAAIGQMHKSEVAKERLANSGSELQTNTPEEYAAYLQKDINRWVPLVKSSGATAE